MYWLLDEVEQKRVRDIVTNLTLSLSTITGNPQIDQLFPYVGRKDRRKAETIISNLTSPHGIVCDPFSGSGIHAYAITSCGRQLAVNEWEPYANRISSAPWRVPDINNISDAFSKVLDEIRTKLNSLYWTRCSCGNDHILHSLFFDRDPLNYFEIAKHERLGDNGENIVYRNNYRCPICLETEKFFDVDDLDHMNNIEKLPIDEIFNYKLIENSRINLSAEYTTYGALFPHRAKIALKIIWDGIHSINCDLLSMLFLEDTFLSILPQAKYKDYRSKSQDLHCPGKMLREVNLLYVFIEQHKKRLLGLINYGFENLNNNPISMRDYRNYLDNMANSSVDLVFTDPPWTDGTAYFERAQLYHPWIGYDLKSDPDRLEREMVVTDAPSRRGTHDFDRWWSDLEIFFNSSYRILKPNQFLALFFRPIPARYWLANLNRIKLIARKSGFEPLLSIDVGSSDPSMRIQQSASYVFSKDIVLLFLKLEPNIRRFFHQDIDIDQLVYQSAVAIQEEKHSSFLYKEWREEFSKTLHARKLDFLNAPKEEERIFGLFIRYCDEVTPGNYLPKVMTPFSDQLFDTPAIERLFTYVPMIIENLTENNNIFTYDQFLLSIAEYVENGTRQLINNIQSIDIRALIETYAIATGDGQTFMRRPLPELPEGISNIFNMDPYDFEIFIGKLYEAQGFTSVAIIGRSGDRGVDVTGIDPEGRRTVIQCKRYIATNISSEPVQRLHSFAITRGASRKILVTTSDFTPQGRDEAEITQTELINRHELERMIATYFPNGLS